MAVSPEQEEADIPVVAVDTPAPVAEQAWAVAVDLEYGCGETCRRVVECNGYT